VSAAERRRAQSAALVAQHPRWRGIRHPELIAIPPRRYSQLDMLPAVEYGRAWPLPPQGPRREDAHAQRVERTLEIIARHPRWRGILHPDRIVFPESELHSEPLLAYRAAVRQALEGVHKSQDLYQRIAAVADTIERRRWPWAASPAGASAIAPSAVPASHRRLPRLPTLRPPSGRPARPLVRPTHRLVAH
jgi:hypothetical protein